jgi:hypothetical protein
MAKVSKVSVLIPGALLPKIEREASSLQIDAASERGRAALAGVGRFEAADLTRANRAARDSHDRRR